MPPRLETRPRARIAGNPSVPAKPREPSHASPTSDHPPSGTREAPRTRAPPRTIPRVTPVAHRWTFAAVVAALLVLHVDVWNAGAAPTLVLGWLPWDLAYHLAWMACAAAAVLYMTSDAIWPEDQDPEDPP